MVVPPRSWAVLSTADLEQQSPRERHIQLMTEHGCMAWQCVTRDGRRNAAATAVGRYERLIGPRLRARSTAAWAGEVALAINVLNRMVRDANPVTVRRT